MLTLALKKKVSYNGHPSPLTDQRLDIELCHTPTQAPKLSGDKLTSMLVGRIKSPNNCCIRKVFSERATMVCMEEWENPHGS